MTKVELIRVGRKMREKKKKNSIEQEENASKQTETCESSPHINKYQLENPPLLSNNLGKYIS